MVTQEDKLLRESVGILQKVFGPHYLRGFDVQFWDGQRVTGSGSRRFILCVNAPFALRAAFAPPFDLNCGRAFVDGVLDVEGDLEAAVDLLEDAIDGFEPARAASLAAGLLHLPKPPARDHPHEAVLKGRLHSRQRDQDAVRFHYDHAVEFYRTFLGDDLVYSCAYFPDDASTLEEAQRAKIDYVLRKVRLKPGERLLDIGCGWGSLVIRAAEAFGARATGITLSKIQCAEANRRIGSLGLSSHVRVEPWDYRELPPDEVFDKVVSIGMVEHVGGDMLDAYFQSAFAALRPGGLFLNHGIAARLEAGRKPKRNGFIDRYVFPDGELVPLSDGLCAAERAGFEVRDVENLREHYALTLRRWVSNLERNRDAAVAAAGIDTYRIWRLYMAASASAFRRAKIAVYQSLLARPHGDGWVELPPSRGDLYVS